MIKANRKRSTKSKYSDVEIESGEITLSVMLDYKSMPNQCSDNIREQAIELAEDRLRNCKIYRQYIKDGYEEDRHLRHWTIINSKTGIQTFYDDDGKGGKETVKEKAMIWLKIKVSLALQK